MSDNQNTNNGTNQENNGLFRFFSKPSNLLWTFVIIIVGLPLILTNRFFYIVNFKDTGPIGDTIGGITAPFIGAIVGILSYMAFIAQIKANKQSVENFQAQLNKQSFDQTIIHYINIIISIRSNTLKDNNDCHSEELFRCLFILFIYWKDGLNQNEISEIENKFNGQYFNVFVSKFQNKENFGPDINIKKEYKDVNTRILKYINYSQFNDKATKKELIKFGIENLNFMFPEEIVAIFMMLGTTIKNHAKSGTINLNEEISYYNIVTASAGKYFSCFVYLISIDNRRNEKLISDDFEEHLYIIAISIPGIKKYLDTRRKKI